MPKKLNKAGQQQEYVPSGNGDASGEYADDGGSNRHFVAFKKPEEHKKQEPKETKPQELGVKVEDKGEKPADITQIKPKYDGKGKQVLADSLKKRLGKSANGKILIEQLQDADDEISGVIGDFYENNPQVNLKIGKNLNSKYMTRTNYFGGQWNVERTVAVGQGLFTDQDSYSKGGVFFHESGHGLDATYVSEAGKIRGEWSHDYVSTKHGKKMYEMIWEEIRQHKDKYQELKQAISDEEKQIATKYWNDDLNKELEDLQAERLKIRQEVNNNEKLKEFVQRENKYYDEIRQIRVRFRESGFADNNIENELNEKRKELVAMNEEKVNFVNSLYQSYPEYEAKEKRAEELIQQKYDSASKARGDICKKYGDLSDMFEGSGVGSLCGMGHGYGYWNDRHRGNEAFAEITSAKATNPESLELMKKYIPKTLEIYEEIMDKIRNAKA